MKIRLIEDFLLFSDVPSSESCWFWKIPEIAGGKPVSPVPLHEGGEYHAERKRNNSYDDDQLSVPNLMDLQGKIQEKLEGTVNILDHYSNLSNSFMLLCFCHVIRLRITSFSDQLVEVWRQRFVTFRSKFVHHRCWLRGRSSFHRRWLATDQRTWVASWFLLLVSLKHSSSWKLGSWYSIKNDKNTIIFWTFCTWNYGLARNEG